jgi:hypothetical protein
VKATGVPRRGFRLRDFDANYRLSEREKRRTLDNARRFVPNQKKSSQARNQNITIIRIYNLEPLLLALRLFRAIAAMPNSPVLSKTIAAG